MYKILPFLVVFYYAIGCKKPVKITTTAYIIGDNDIETYDPSTSISALDDILQSSVILTVPTSAGGLKFCSGSLIERENPNSNLRIITNHHCFAAKSLSGDTSLKGNEKQCALTKVFFGFSRANVTNKELKHCKPGTFRSDSQLDLAIFELSDNPSEIYRPIEIAPEEEIHERKQSVIVHFPKIEASHPQLEEKTFLDEETIIRLPLAQVTSKNCHTLGPFPPQDWSMDPSLGFGIRHSCDQANGSSGSALVNQETGHLIGVNWGGVKIGREGDENAIVVNVATAVPYVSLFIEDKVEAAKQNINTLAQMDHDAESHDPICGAIGQEGHNLSWTIILLFMPLSLLLLRKNHS